VLELRPCEVAVVACHARPGALDELAPARALPFRVAPDELLLLAAPDAADAVGADAARALAERDAGALVLDRSDAFAAFTLGGDGADEAFRRLSAVPLPAERPALLQGLVAHVPARVLALEGSLHVLVPASVDHHLRARVLEACADLAPAERPPAPLALLAEAAR
jgi:hypothetical protein